MRTLLYSKVFLVAVGAALLSLQSASAEANNSRNTANRGGSATIVEIIEPASTEVSIDHKIAKLRDKALYGSLVKTGYARAALEFNSHAVLRMGRDSEVTIGGPCFYLVLGTALSSGTSDICVESLDIDSPQTIYIVSVQPDSGTKISVLEGRVIVRQASKNPSRRADPEGAVVINAASERSFTLNGIARDARNLTLNDYRNILNGELFLGFSRPLPDQQKLERVLADLLRNQQDGSTIKADPGDQYGF